MERRLEIGKEIRQLLEQNCDCVLSIRTCWRCRQIKILDIELMEIQNENHKKDQEN